MTKIHTIQEGTCQITPLAVAETDSLKAWLAEKAKEYQLTTLLAHADNGVVWGKVDDGTLVTACEVFKQMGFPSLDWQTLQQARLFGPEAELLLWRVDDQWQARLVQENEGQAVTFYDEFQMLWGTYWKGQCQGFTLVTDGGNRHRHAPPINAPEEMFPGKNQRPLRLQTRHYLTIAEDGLHRVLLSRLVKLSTHAQEKEKEQ